MTTSTDPLAGHAAAKGDETAVIVDAHGGAPASRTTWAELDAEVNRLVHGLYAAGAARGDRLVWCGPNSLEVLTTLHASRKAGFVAVPLSYRFTIDEMAYVIDNAEATTVVVDAEQAPDVLEAVGRCPRVARTVVYGGEVPPGALAWDTVVEGRPTEAPDVPATTAGAAMIYTSGTTGKPKGALRTRTDPGVVFAMLDTLRLMHPDPVHLTTGPLYHSGPLAFATLAHTVGGPIVVLRRFDAATWLRLVTEHRVTNTFSAPTQLKRIVSRPAAELAAADLSSMVCLIANAAPVPYALKREIVEKLGDGFLFEVYGSTELGVDCILEPEDQLRKPGSCGKPYGGIEVRIVGDDGREVPTGERGELFVRTPLAMDGYHRTDEQLTTLEEDGWKSVGDVAYLDDEGYVYICDRIKDMIISGGVNIYPAEVEAVCYEHPDVLDAAVFGIPDDEWGERVHCVVQAKAGHDLDTDDLAAFVEARVARYMRPRAYEVAETLPRTDSGKLLKRVLRDRYWAGRDRSV